MRISDWSSDVCSSDLLADKRRVTPDSLFRIASMTKAFTALAILKLRDDGKLRLDDLAEQHIPEMKGWTYPTKDSPRIRVRDLLQHVDRKSTRTNSRH